jgi:peptidoglycan/xylan/chitin deacetylase (PgdA/CDA1 family)
VVPVLGDRVEVGDLGWMRDIVLRHAGAKHRGLAQNRESGDGDARGSWHSDTAALECPFANPSTLRLGHPMLRYSRVAWDFAQDLIARSVIGIQREAFGLIALLFHAIDPVDSDSAASTPSLLDPTVRTSLLGLEGCIVYFLAAGYLFVSPDEIEAGLDPSKRWILLTFDDGYSNNLSVLPILERYRVPAVFFISTKHVSTGEAFWWDALYRARAKTGADMGVIQAEQNRLKVFPASAIEDYMRDTFGPGALDVVGEMDRPMTPDELRRFAASPWVHLGNHTHDHAILPNYDSDGAELQIRRCQDWLSAEVGVRPKILAYPNGDVAPHVVDAALRCGLTLGLTTVCERVRLPIPPGTDRMLLARFSVRDGLDTPRTYRRFRTHPTALYSVARRLLGESV